MRISRPNHEIVRVPSVGQSGREQLRQQCYDVRTDVFHLEQGFPLDAEIDEYVSKTLTPALAVTVALAAPAVPVAVCCPWSGQGFVLISDGFAD